MKLKLLTDENIAKSVVNALRRTGYDVKDVKEEKLFGISDEEVLELANKENRVIITHDKDFANLINNPNQKHSGIVLVRFSDQTPENVINKLLPLLKKLRDKIKNAFLLVADDMARII
ncbi:MAG: DUF5615 family PIN-like protein [Candidatus Aenigmarchaeota archaeon]|nr:DUF5615 family PIN-like protein [Candidatus Aenigmarchaeota archaeon]